MKCIYKQLVDNVRDGFLALDEDTQSEILHFLKKQQNDKGAFVDRAGQADLYYSLFGLWLSMATHQTEQLLALKNYVNTREASQSNGLIDEFAWSLIKVELCADFKKQSTFSIFWGMLKKGKMIDFSYLVFLFALLVDAYGKNKGVIKWLVKWSLVFYKPKNNVSCSLTSALLFARKMLGLKTKKSLQQLNAFIHENGGFKAFISTKNADGLSTGVALFVLKNYASDLRLIKPDCLGFIQDNYSEGAFLSGDGDKTKDLEYTFYGLLGLGSLINVT